MARGRIAGMLGARRTSHALLVLAVALTLSVAWAADSYLWRLYHVTSDGKAAAQAIDPRDEDALVVAIGRTSGGPGEWITYARVFSRVQRDTGRKVILRYVADPAAHVKLLGDGETDVALISVRAYLKMRESHAPSIVAVPYTKGNPSDAAVIVVKATSGINDLTDLKGNSIALSDDLVSRPVVEWMMRKRGHTISHFFGRVETGRVMDANLARVAKGQVDATAVRRSALSTWPTGTFRIITQSPPFGMPPLVVRDGLDPQLVEAVRGSVMQSGARGVIPAASSIGGFTLPSEAEYAFPAEMARLEAEMKRAAAGGGQ